MSAGDYPEDDAAVLAEDDVVAYLREHADIFDRHPGLIAELRVPHGCDGASTSTSRC